MKKTQLGGSLRKLKSFVKNYLLNQKQCEFPDRTRRKLENDYYERWEIETINKIIILLNNYKRKLVEFIKLEYN